MFIMPSAIPAAAERGVSAIILSGGPSSVTLTNSPKCNLEIYELGIPILGICYGQQLMISDLGGTVKTSKNREFGRTEVTLNSEKNYPLFNNIFTNPIIDIILVLVRSLKSL